MKDHLAIGEYAFIMCGKSGGRGPQDKGVIGGMPLDMFLSSDIPCLLCQRKLMEIVNRKRRSKRKDALTFEQYKERKLKSLNK